MGNYRMRFYKAIFSLFDVFLVNLGFLLAFWIKFGYEIPLYNWTPYVSLVPWISISSFVIFYMFDLYSNWRRKSLYNLIYSIILSIVMLSLITVVLTFWYRGFSFPRSVIFLAAIIQIILFVLIRSVIWWFAKRLYGQRKVLIVDKDVESSFILAQKFMQHTKGWFIIHKFLPVQNWRTEVGIIHEVDVVLLGISLNREEKAEVLSYCAKFGKEVLVIPELFELFVLEAEPQQIDDMLVLSIQPPGLSAAQLFVKRVFDVCISTIAIVLLSPVMCILYIVIPLTSEGRAIFKQERIGRDGKEYLIYKFRSMIQYAEKNTGPMLAEDGDPRITPLGKMLRSTRLDEIPQLFNVLKGDMSLVGPRPERAFFIKQFQREFPDYAYRMSVKPGITGLAQVMAKYSTSVEDKLRFDLMYVRNYSLALDMKILLQTLRVVLQGSQAEGVRKYDKEEEKKFIEMLGISEIASTKTQNMREL